MKDAFKLFAIIVVSVFLIDKVVYYLISEVDSQIVRVKGTGKLNYFFKIKDSTQYLIFGSSRANHHLNPSILGESTFNMGEDATKLAYSAALIKTLPEDKKQTIFLHVDPSSIFDIDYKGEDIGFLKRKYHKNKIIRDEIDKIDQNNFFSSFLWSTDFNGELGSLFKDYFSSKNTTRLYNGYDPLVLSSKQKEIVKSKFENLEEKACLEVYKPSNISIELLRDIRDFAIVNHKQLILFTSPLYSDNCKKNNEALAALLSELNFDYYDFSDFFQDKSKIEYWKDRTHLSQEGAELFSTFFFKHVKLATL